MPQHALLLAYDGTDFLGWWRQKDGRSVAGELDAAFARIGEPAAAPVGASRTDAGVHARRQVAHAKLARPWTPEALHHALAAQLPADLACLAVADVDDDWHATHMAVGKTYTYRIDNGTNADPFVRRTSWRPPFRLSLEALRAAAAPIPGRRDWRAFSRRGEAREDTIRTIESVAWHTEGKALICTLDGSGFIYRLARSLVGAMVAVANGTCSRDDLERALRGDDSPAGEQQAPAHGLCLDRVRYAHEPLWRRHS